MKAVFDFDITIHLQRNRKIEYGGTAVLGRSDDQMKKAMKEMNEMNVKMGDMTEELKKLRKSS